MLEMMTTHHDSAVRIVVVSVSLIEAGLPWLCVTIFKK